MQHVLASIHAVLLLGCAAAAVRAYAGTLGHKLAAAFLLTWGNLVVTGLVLGLLGHLDHISWYLTLSCTLAVGTAALFRSRAAGGTRLPMTALLPPVDDAPLRPGPLVAFAVGSVVLAFVASLTIIAFIHPNNFDSLAYRFPRPFLYLSQGHIGHPTRGVDFRLSEYPLNAPLGYAFLAAYGLNGRFFSVPSLVCWLLAGVGVWLLARDIGASRKGTLLATSVYLLSPVVLVCSSSGNDELIAAAPILLGVVFLHRWWHTASDIDALLGALGLGLGGGTKLHWMFFIGYVPVVAGALLWNLVRAGHIMVFLRQRAMQLVLIGLITVGLCCPFAVANKVESGYWVHSPKSSRLIANQPFRARVALINAEILSAQLFLSPIPDVLVATDRARIERWYEWYNKLWAWAFAWFDDSDEYSPPWYRFRGVSLPEGRYSEFSLWIGFTPYLLVLALGCLVFRRRSRAVRIAGWLAVGFFAWHLSYVCLTRYIETAGVYYSYPLTLSAAGLAVLWDIGERVRVIRGAFVAVLATHALVAVNIFGFSTYRSVTEVVNNKFAVKKGMVEHDVVKELRSAKNVEIAYTEWELHIFQLMTRSPLSRYRVVGPREAVHPDVLRVYCLPANTRWGFMELRYPGECACRLTRLGTMNTVYGTERVFGVGAGVHDRRSAGNGFIALKALPSKVRENRWCESVRFEPLVFGLGEGEAIELRVEERLADGRERLLADWQTPVALARQPIPLVPGEGENFLIVSARSPVNPDQFGSAVFPLANER